MRPVTDQQAAFCPVASARGRQDRCGLYGVPQRCTIPVLGSTDTGPIICNQRDAEWHDWTTTAATDKNAGAGQHYADVMSAPHDLTPEDEDKLHALLRKPDELMSFEDTPVTIEHGVNDAPFNLGERSLEHLREFTETILNALVEAAPHEAALHALDMLERALDQMKPDTALFGSPTLKVSWQLNIRGIREAVQHHKERHG